MPSKDWFRRITWSQDDEAAFFSRLSRSRGAFHKAQYLRLQALTLAETHQDALVPTALRLLNRLFEESPEESQLAAAHLLAAKCQERVGDLDEAVRHFRLALAAQSRFRGIDPGTALEFPWFIVEHKLTALYDDALSTLESAHLAFPIQVFRAATVRALVAESRRDLQAASRYAREAIAAARMKVSPLRYHRDLGLVGEEYQRVIEQLTKLAAA